MKSFLKRLLILIALGQLALGSSGCGGDTASPSTVNSRETESTAARPDPDRSLAKIVAFGDSLTAGFGLSESESYPSLLQKMLEDDGFEYRVVNAGVSGDTSAGGLRRLDWALDGDVRIVILELGGNDILRGQPVSAMKQNLSHIIERIKEKDAIILLAGMEAPTSSGIDYQLEVRRAFRELASEHDVAFMPFFLADVAGIDSLNLSDGIHPNAQGTRIVASNVYAALKPLLEADARRSTR